MDIAARRRAMGVALEALEAGLWNAAETICRTCVDLARDNARLRHDYAAYLLERDVAEEAEQVLLPASESAVGQHHIVGLTLTEQGKFRGAVPRFQRAAALDPAPSMSRVVTAIGDRFAAAVHPFPVRQCRDAA